MGFESVYMTLKELFPQLDSRLLKAVAIEHSKDHDSAVEYILAEVLPHDDDQSSTPTPAAEKNGKAAETSNASSSMLDTSSTDGAIFSSHLNDGPDLNDSATSPFYDANDIADQITENPLGEGTKVINSETFDDLEGVSSALPEATEIRIYLNGNAISPSACDKDGDGGVDGDGDVDVSLGGAERSLCNVEDVHRDYNNGSPDPEQGPSALSWISHPDVESDTNIHIANAGEMTNFLNSEFTIEFADNDDVGAENETLSSTIMTRSGQVCRVSLLQDIIEEAKTYKESVCSAMESVVRLMEEVDHQENEAEQAKEASSRGGLDILEKVEEIKKMLIHAKEANDMHAGEVYGEKSILATEVKELQARLLGLSDEKDKSLSMLDEMRKSLEERLAVAEEQKRAAEKVMFDKKEIAQVALTEQELIMDKVVQESKLLQEEAEENAKLRDFLMEKGRVVDVLQGEISVICQDVKMLKENFDNRVSLSKLLSIEKTSSHLASSNSSVKSAASLRSVTSLKSTASLDRTVSLKSTSSSKSTTSLKSTASEASDLGTDILKFPESPRRIRGGEENFVSYEATPQKTLLDDDWELCDMI